jgi:DnaK suppressor protein
VKKPVAKTAPTKPVAVKKAVPAKKPVPAAKKVVAKKAVPGAKKSPPRNAAPATKAARAAKSAAAKPVPAKKSDPAKKPAAVKKPAPAKQEVISKKPVPAQKQAAAKKVVTAPLPETTPVPGKPAKTGKSAKATKVTEPKPVVVSSAQRVPRKPGKVAVAVIAKPSSPAPKAKFKVVPYRTDDSNGRPLVPNGYKPAADEEYMSTLQLEYFRQRLMSWRADLVEESKQTIENLKEEVRDVGDEAERATRETENSLELRTRDRYRKLIGKIDSTLKRLDNGDYGYCVDTGEEIGLDRLEARLTAERTIDAQERWEHMQKQMGD